MRSKLDIIKGIIALVTLLGFVILGIKAMAMCIDKHEVIDRFMQFIQSQHQ